MRHFSMVLALIILSGLLISSQALTAGRFEPTDDLQVAALTGEQLQQWHMAQMHPHDQFQAKRTYRQLTSEQAIELKRQLNKQGYSISNLDGIIDNEAMAAIERFQLDKGLAVTGLPNQETLGALTLSTPQQEFFGIAPEFGEDEE